MDFDYPVLSIYDLVLIMLVCSYTLGHTIRACLL